MKKFLSKLKKGFGLIDEKSQDHEASESKGEHQQNKKPETSATHKSATSLPPASTLRDDITRFIIHALQPYIDEKTIAVSGLSFYILCLNKEEEMLAASALMLHRPDAFRKEYLERKLLNNFIKLADNWFFECRVVQDTLPNCSSMQNKYGLDISVGNTFKTSRHATAFLKTIVGQTTLGIYELNSLHKNKYSIGRGERSQLSSGRIHINDIIFLNKDDAAFDEQKAKGNISVSRNHAYIKYDAETNNFFLYADKGGLLESVSKIKLYKTNDSIYRLDIAGTGHELHEGDIIELGGEAKLLFTFLPAS